MPVNINHEMSDSSSQGPTVTIIGGGFSGTMTAVNFIRKTAGALTIHLIEKSKKLHTGVAYGTDDPFHILNVRAKNMSAFDDDKSHFFHWLQQNEPLWRDLDPSFHRLKISPEAFIPRLIYGKYLESIWKETVALAKKKKIHLNIIHEEVVDIGLQNNKMEILLSSGKKLQTDYAVLTIGVPSHKKIFFKGNSEKHPHYIRSIWERSLDHIKPHSKVAIIGSGLTMIDAFISLVKRQFVGEFIVISRGTLPVSHISNEKNYPEFMLENSLKSSLKIFQRIRKEIKEAAQKGYHWVDVMNSLRPHTSAVWSQLSWEERRKAMRHLIALFLKYRHRVPQEETDKITKEQFKGLFIFKSAAVDSIEDKGQKLIVNYSTFNSTDHIEVDYVINCCGPELRINNTDSTLLQNLLKSKLIKPDPLGLGIKATPFGSAEGSGTDKLFVIGLLLFGERLETIAVPDLRIQCSDVATHILNNLS